jgi:hypothetical protein
MQGRLYGRYGSDTAVQLYIRQWRPHQASLWPRKVTTLLLPSAPPPTQLLVLQNLPRWTPRPSHRPMHACARTGHSGMLLPPHNPANTPAMTSGAEEEVCEASCVLSGMQAATKPATRTEMKPTDIHAMSTTPGEAPPCCAHTPQGALQYALQSAGDAAAGRLKVLTWRKTTAEAYACGRLARARAITRETCSTRSAASTPARMRGTRGPQVSVTPHGTAGLGSKLTTKHFTRYVADCSLQWQLVVPGI